MISLNFLNVLSVNVAERLSFFGRLYNMDTNPDTGMWMMIGTIFILLVVVYNLGFARKIKLWQNIIIYIVMFIGTIMLAFLGVFYPVAESLIIAAIVLGLYRFRLHNERQNNEMSLDEKKALAQEESKAAMRREESKMR